MSRIVTDLDNTDRPIEGGQRIVRHSAGSIAHAICRSRSERAQIESRVAPRTDDRRGTVVVRIYYGAVEERIATVDIQSDITTRVTGVDFDVRLSYHANSCGIHVRVEVHAARFDRQQTNWGQPTHNRVDIHITAHSGVQCHRVCTVDRSREGHVVVGTATGSKLDISTQQGGSG